MRKKHKKKVETYIKNCIGNKEFKDEFHKWNFILKQEGKESIQPGKASIVEQREQQKHKKKGLPGWAKGRY
jgi:hypothetical protein